VSDSSVPPHKNNPDNSRWEQFKPIRFLGPDPRRPLTEFIPQELEQRSFHTVLSHVKSHKTGLLPEIRVLHATTIGLNREFYLTFDELNSEIFLPWLPVIILQLHLQTEQLLTRAALKKKRLASKCSSDTFPCLPCPIVHHSLQERFVFRTVARYLNQTGTSSHCSGP
jgi:hypothetical protein